MKFPFVIYASTDSLLEKIDAWYNNPKVLSTAKVSKHIAININLITKGVNTLRKVFLKT